MKQATVYIVILGILCLGAGVAIGMVVEKERAKSEFRHMFAAPRSGYPGAGHWFKDRRGLDRRERMKPGVDRLSERISKELDLTTAQREKVEAILEENRQQVKQARDSFKTQLDQVRENCHAQIAQLLSPKQKEKFEQLTTRIEDRRGKGCWR